MITYATIPYRNRPELTVALLTQLADEEALQGVILLDHDSTWETNVVVAGALVDRLDLIVQRFPAEANLTQMWNWAWEMAIDTGVDSLAILNNDIIIPAGFIGHLHNALWEDDSWWAVCPNWKRTVAEGTIPGITRPVSGAERHSGMCGWAFMVKVAARLDGLPEIDPQFRWWCGDDDLAFSIELHGHKVGLLEGLPVDHIRSATFHNSGLHQMAHEDLARCIEKWGK